MRILILNSDGRLTSYHFAQLIHQYDAEAEVHLINSFEPQPYQPPVDPRPYDSFRTIFTRGETELFSATVDRLCREHKIDRILAMSEEDITPAAAAREKFSLAGMKPDVAEVFRDKIAMKQKAAKSGLRVPRHAPLSSLSEAERFCEKNGFPVILKQRAGVSSIGVKKANSSEELAKEYASIESAGAISDYEIEEFIEGTLYHVDGFVVEGAPPLTWPSRYSTGCFEFAQGKAPLQEELVDSSEAVFKTLRVFAEKVISEFRLVNSTFHIEVFENKKGELIFLEAACRTSGEPVADVWRTAFGIDLDRASILLQSGLAIDQHQKIAKDFASVKKPRCFVTTVNIPRRTGVLTKIGRTPPEGTRVTFSLQPHLIYNHWQSLGAISCNGWAEGTTQEDARQRIGSFIAWYERTYVWKNRSFWSTAVRAYRKIARKLNEKVEVKTYQGPKLNVVIFGKSQGTTLIALHEIAKRHNITGIVHSTIYKEGLFDLIFWRRKLFGYARLHGIPYLWINQKNMEDLVPFLERLEKDVGVTANYSFMIRDFEYSMFKHGMYNIHPAILPKYRGMQAELWQYLKGDMLGGVTVHKVDRGENTGPIAGQEIIYISRDTSAFNYTNQCLQSGAKILSKVFTQIASGAPIYLTEQADLRCPVRGRKVEKTDTLIDWQNDSHEQILHSAKAIATIFPLYRAPKGLAECKRWHPVAIRKTGTQSRKLAPLTLSPDSIPVLGLEGKNATIDFGRGTLVFSGNYSLDLLIRYFLK